LRTLQRSTGATQVCVLYQVPSNSSGPPFDPSGYLPPGLPYTPPTGINSFKTIFGHPEVHMRAMPKALRPLRRLLM